MKPVLGSRAPRQVAFVGPFGVGKTTAVFTLCGAGVSATEVQSSLVGARGGRHVKPSTTVGLEMGEWTAPDGRSVSIVGTPGQERFDLVRRSAMPRSSGVVLWLFGDHVDAGLDAELWLEFIAKEVPVHKIVVAMTRLVHDEALEIEVEAFRTIIDRLSPSIPLVVADPRERADVEAVMAAALDTPMAFPVEQAG